MRHFEWGWMFIFVLSFPVHAYAEESTDTLATGMPLIYIDYQELDLDFIKTEIPYVNYVIDRAVADIYVLITTEETAAGGTEYTVNFTGQKKYEGMSDTLTYISGEGDSDDTIRRGIAAKLKLGLMRYIGKTPIADDISISFLKKTRPMITKDEWHNWVFSISVNSYLNGEQSRRFNSFYGSLAANHTTNDWKTRLQVNYMRQRSEFDINDTTTIMSTTENYGGSSFLCRSLNRKFSAAISAGVYSSTYSNTRIGGSVGPLVEFDFFPYDQATSRELRTSYKIGYKHELYNDTTIYDETENRLLYESVSMTLDIKQRWGSITTTMSGSHYFYDYKKNHLTVYGTISLPIVKGLSFDITGQGSRIHDQLSLAKKGLTPEEILLQMRQMDTQFDYYAQIGLTYSFGSVYSNIVNPRFGN